ncbi:MAG: hypothetical protein P8N02_11260 [Actinomycetota bacterium]|nr:hypothetical protein [Actinomycetota bacterium]
MRNSQIVNYLAGVPLFSECTKKDLQSVARHSEKLSVESGTEIVCQSNEGSAFYLLLDGTVKSTSPVQLLALTTRMFNVAMGDLPRLRRRLLSSMATRLRELDRKA